MKKLKLIIFLFAFLALLTSKIDLNYAYACPIKTIDLSRNNQKGKFNEIVALQGILSLYPNFYSGVELVGVFGPKTENAIKKIQTDNGLPANGVITKDTLDLICQQYYYCPFKSMIGRGDDLNPEQTIEVKILQAFLKFIPKVSYTGPVTGFFGILTEQALTKFQNNYNLYPTKILDFDTIDSLCEIFDNINNITLSQPKTVSQATTTTTPKPLIAVCVSDPKEPTINQRVNFLAQVTGGTPPYRYYWSGYASGNEKNSSNVFTGNGTYTAILKIIDNANKTTETSCQANVGGIKTSQTPTINIPPISLPSNSTPQTPSTFSGNVTIQMTSDFHEIRNSSDQINIFWTSNNAETCYATSAPTHNSWDGPMDLRGQKTLSNINITPGNAAIFTLICNNKNKTEVKYIVIERKQ